ncbi:2-hydroxyacyl-CoA dehydratase family protein [Citricoccus sp. NPDC055426]|uniref:2-hydroxyacyl-CoA dehydratase family protein n=1 Tax=Citricoccus sp. NPDC055426 TaxID=3155536 RepID=UPI00343F4016
MTRKWQGARSVKRLESVREATALNRANNERMWADIAAGKQFVFGYGPMELFNAMGLYLILPVQYGSVLAAKQLYGHYQSAIERRGYFSSLANYESLPLGYCFEPDDGAPYGGLPKPAAIFGGYMQEPGIYELYAREFDVPAIMTDDPYRQQRIPDGWWDGPEWRDRRIVDFSVEELRTAVRMLEQLTGVPYRETDLRDLMMRANEMSEYYERIVQLGWGGPGPALFTATDAYSEVAVFETHFGQEWALDHVKRVHAEVAERAADGAVAVPNERTRLLWAGTPLWFNLGFLNAWEESHGAVFIETMYLPRAKRLIQDPSEDALRAAFLRRHMKYTGSSPKAAAELIISQCREFGVDGVVLPARAATRDTVASSRYMALALKRAGIDVLQLDYAPFDSEAWDQEAMHAQVTDFIEGIQVHGQRV